MLYRDLSILYACRFQVFEVILRRIYRYKNTAQLLCFHSIWGQSKSEVNDP